MSKNGSDNHDPIDVSRQQVARSSTLSFVGAAVSAAMGFLLTLAVARSMGAEGAGVLLQAIAVFSIALGIARLGMDTTAVWILPIVARDDPSRLRGTLARLLLPATLAGVVLGIGIYLAQLWIPRSSDPLSG